jgi:hypothetical protein
MENNMPRPNLFPNPGTTEGEQLVNQEIVKYTLPINQLNIDQKQFALLQSTGMDQARTPGTRVPDSDKDSLLFSLGVPMKQRSNIAEVSMITSARQARDVGVDQVKEHEYRFRNARGEDAGSAWVRDVQTSSGASKRTVISLPNGDSRNYIVIRDETFDERATRTGRATIEMEADYKQGALRTTRTINGTEEGVSTQRFPANTGTEPQMGGNSVSPAMQNAVQKANDPSYRPRDPNPLGRQDATPPAPLPWAPSRGGGAAR